MAFGRKFARGVLKNKLYSDGQCPGIPAYTRRRSSGSPVPDRELCTCPKFTGAWDFTKNEWLYVKTKYLKTRCYGCSCNVRSYFYVRRKLPCVPNAGGSINQLRATYIKINLLVIMKIDIFDYYVANSSSIRMVPNGIFGLGVCRLVPWGVISISRGSGIIVSTHSLFPI